jgi:TetR/AcrR family transcriptional regulator
MVQHATNKTRNSGKERLIQAAVELAQEQPFDDITIEEIITSARLSRPAFYYHFAGGKEELRGELVQRGVLEEAPAHDTRKAILEAAQRVFARSGVSAATLDDIASEAGVTRGALCWHYHSKEDLLEGIIKNCGPYSALRQVVETIEQEIQSGDRLSDEDLIRRLVEACYNGFTKESNAARLAILLANTHPEAATLIASKITNGRKRVVEYIEQRQREGHFNSRINASFFVQVMATTFAMRAVGGDLYELLPFAHLTREETIDQFSSLLLYGIVSRETSSDGQRTTSE